MQLDAQQLQEASNHVLAARDASGLIAAAAMYAVASGIAPTKRDKHHLADECRTASLKAMASAREDLERSMATH